MIFDVPGKDYYKVCLVQDIEGTPTEIGGIKTTLDVGQGYYVNVLNKTTLGGIQGILNAHQETSLLSIGDEVTIKVNGADTVFQIGGINLYDSHEVIFVAKRLTDSTSSGGSANNYSTTPMKSVMDSFYNNIDLTDRTYIKAKTVKSGGGANGNTLAQTSCYVWLPTAYEITGTTTDVYTPTTEQNHNIQFPLFITEENRIRMDSNGVAQAYYTASRSRATDQVYYASIVPSGVSSHSNGQLRLLPCFHLTADS